MHELSKSQLSKLLKNPNVEKVTAKNVQFTSKFKLYALKKYFDGKSPTEVFREAGIDPTFFKDKYCNSCLKRWRKKLQEQGPESFGKEQRGQTSRSKKPTYEELEAIVAIQREVLGYSKK